MNRFGIFAGLLVAGVGLSGCNGGTTYGTGVSHERQTLEGIANIFSLRNKKNDEKIDYSARPDLIMPANAEQLPQPVEVEASTSNPAWPETPGERIARIRGEAVAPDERSGEIPLEELLREKEGIRVTKANKAVGAEIDRDGNQIIDEIVSKKADAKHKAAKRKLAYSVGPKRKYLTEPPEIYRTPATTAVAGDQGLDRKIVDERKKQEEAYREELLRSRD